ncbi:hypothetical protein [uncultured Desulfuromonas sp.]|uniref:hypothetical protein n=1 Tax=uncultured Desulfuromonas sp. TaxID=181013 RepID=UPI0026176F9E|nr:hypothetical protein [uncultured Desulfuromonas sp.]
MVVIKLVAFRAGADAVFPEVHLMLTRLLVQGLDVDQVVPRALFSRTIPLPLATGAGTGIFATGDFSWDGIHLLLPSYFFGQPMLYTSAAQ